MAAIRLNSVFCVWASKEISLTIDQHNFISGIWVNFPGYPAAEDCYAAEHYFAPQEN